MRDRAGQFTGPFDEVFTSVGGKVIAIPSRAPQANAFAERWVGTVRHELLDRTLIWNQRQLRRLLQDYVGHYNSHRPHRSVHQRAPFGAAAAVGHGQTIRRHTVDDGLINQYRPAA